MAIKCPRCGAKNPNDAVFCVECGKVFEVSEPRRTKESSGFGAYSPSTSYGGEKSSFSGYEVTSYETTNDMTDTGEKKKTTVVGYAISFMIMVLPFVIIFYAAGFSWNFILGFVIFIMILMGLNKDKNRKKSGKS